MNARIIFNEDRHEYTVDGVIVPSVTQILRFLSCDIAAGASPAMRDAAAERGSRVHAACVAYDVDGENAEIDGDIGGYVQAYANFLRDYSISGWDVFEKPLFMNTFGRSYRMNDLYHNPKGYAGTIDRCGAIDGASTLVDIKTGSRINMHICKAQLAAYAPMLRLDGYDVRNAAVLHLKKNGCYGYHPVNPFERAPIRAFCACWRIHDYLKGETI